MIRIFGNAQAAKKNIDYEEQKILSDFLKKRAFRRGVF